MYIRDMAMLSSSNRFDCVKIYYIDDDIDDIETFEFAVNSLNSNARQKIELYAFLEGDVFLRNALYEDSSLQLVFLDVNMPTKSGFEVLTEMKQNLATRKFPVIMFSTSSNKKSIETSRQLGADYYITKPNNFNDLHLLISKAIDLHITPSGSSDFLIT
ncbi:MAG: response regulator [Taibaiella sp.]|nr:response regulator [Taibaiella sp.]